MGCGSTTTGTGWSVGGARHLVGEGLGEHGEAGCALGLEEYGVERTARRTTVSIIDPREDQATCFLQSLEQLVVHRDAGALYGEAPPAVGAMVALVDVALTLLADRDLCVARKRRTAWSIRAPSEIRDPSRTRARDHARFALAE